MVEVKIEYRPVRFLGFRRELTGSFPERFEELTAKQLIGVARLMKGTLTEIGFLNVMTGIRKGVLRRLEPFHQFKLLQLFDAFAKPRPYHEFILKSIGDGRRKLLAPKPKLKGVTFGQFIFADTYYGCYQDGKKEDDLHKFVVSMYLPEGVKFDEKLIEENYGMMKDVEQVTLEAIAINYMLIREWLQVAYPLIFQKPPHPPEGKSENLPAIKKKVFDAMGWIKVFDAMVGDDIVNQDKYANLPMHNVFRYMTGRIKENMKRKK